MTSQNEQLKELRQNRGILKAHLTKFKNFLETSEAKQNLCTMQLRLEKIEKHFESFETIQTKLEILDENEEAGRNEVENSFFESISKARTIIKAYSPNNTQNNITNTGTSSNSSIDPIANLKLPTISLPSFAGNYDGWVSFYDAFKQLIHDNINLSNIQKFYYLKSCLRNDALRLVQSYQVSSDNYSIVWDLIKKRYENKRIIINNHLKHLFELPTVTKESPILLRQLTDAVYYHVTALQKLELPTKQWDVVLIYIVTTKLDVLTNREWENSLDADGSIPTFDQLNNFLNKKCFALETANKKATQISQPINTYKKVNAHHSQQSFTTTEYQQSRPCCPYCQQDHYLFACQAFVNLNAEEKYNEVKKLRLCVNCLRSGHSSRECKSSRCKKCNLNHNTLLHNPEYRTRSRAHSNANQSNERNNENTQIHKNHNHQSHTCVSSERCPVISSTSATNKKDATVINHNIEKSPDQSALSASNISANQSLVLLSTAQILIYDSTGKSHICRALLDSGSQSNIITKSLFEKLNLKSDNINISIAGVNQRISTITQKTKAAIKSQYNNFETCLTFLILPTITNKLPTVEFDKRILDYPKDMFLADPDFNISDTVDVLIGASLFYELILANQYKLGKNMPMLQETLLGWIVTGSLNVSSNLKTNRICNFTTEISNEALNENLIKFWQLEEVPQKRYLSPEEQQCENYFSKTTTRDINGRFIVRLPFAKIINDLGNSKSVAHKRFCALESKFRKDTSLKNAYIEFMNEYEQLGHMTKQESFNLNTKQTHQSYILPHHAILKLNSSTTKCRVVFDASAKTDSNISLNDTLLVGPTVQDDLFAIVIRLRLRSYVLSADIKMMYRQILVHENDRKYQQILWRRDENQLTHLYNLNTVTYGTASAPYLATRVLQQLAFDYEERFPRTSKLIKNSFYMDDLLVSLNSKTEALEVYREISYILATAGFQLRKWSSNDTNILTEIVKDNDDIDKIIEIRDNKELKTLGLSWNSNSDTLNYSINLQNVNATITKRSVLATISRIFDPLGLVGPATIRAKLFMQRLWQLKIAWDEPLAPELAILWSTFLKDMQQINQISVNRQVLCNQAESVELHGFCDASERAYGACIYLVSYNHRGERYSNILCAKSKVAPQKKCTLPRLELLAAVLLAKLVEVIRNTLDIQLSNISFYSDSTIVLAWLQTDPSQLKTFVANRVAKITELSNVNEWKHVPSEHNPADTISRGSSTSEIENSNLWWHGPGFLITNDFNHKINCIDYDKLPEIKKSVVSLTSISKPNRDIFSKYSSLSKLQHVVAYCVRFKRITLDKVKFKSELLTPEELEFSLNLLIKLVQNDEFANEISLLAKKTSLKCSSKILSLNPFLDEFGLLRVGGRLKHSNLDFSAKHPIIIPKSHALTKLIIMHYHLKHLHSGPQNLLSLIRLKYWPIDGKSTIKGVIRSCIKCFKINPKPTKFLMGNLPSSRVIPCRPFSNCGVDYAGPLLIKDRALRNAKLLKAYICIFICFTTRAIHIELVSSLTTDCFLNALKRFISRRGKPAVIHSDNGLNFVGANNHFQELYTLLNDKSHNAQVHNFLANDQIRWTFIPPRSPHIGGLWEASVKSTKFHLRRILGNASLTYEDTYTILIQIEACLNSRPLSPLSSDPDDFLPLTPSHFLIGDSLAAAPQDDVKDLQFTKLSRYHRIQQLTQHFWSRWSREYLTELQKRSKWKANPNSLLQEGTLVILREDHLSPLHWPMARITKLHPGVDNITRVVSVKVPSGKVMQRSVSKISVVPINEHDNSNEL